MLGKVFVHTHNVVLFSLVVSLSLSDQGDQQFSATCRGARLGRFWK